MKDNILLVPCHQSSSTNENTGGQLTDQMVENFRHATGIASVSEAFLKFCTETNGGVPVSAVFMPPKDFGEYWEECRGSEGIDLWLLSGLDSTRENYCVIKESSNAWRVWEVPKELFVIGSDSGGNFILCNLNQEADRTVYYGDHDLLPTLIPLAHSLEDFYDGVEIVQEED